MNAGDNCEISAEIAATPWLTIHPQQAQDWKSGVADSNTNGKQGYQAFEKATTDAARET